VFLVENWLFWQRAAGLSRAGARLFIYLVVSGAAIAAYLGAQVIMGVIGFGKEQMQQRDQRVNDGLDQLL